MGSSSGSHSSHHKRYASPRDSISPYASSYAERRSNQYAQSDSHSRSSVMSDQEGEEPTPRKRISVACLRCRKRKIRCTGDSGNGQPCLNCKNAGHEPCQFLRVASHETPIIKSDSFSYNLDVARSYQARGASIMPPMPTPPLPSSYADPMHVPSGEALAYKNGSAYAYGNKYYPMSTWTNGYVEDGNVDYAVYPQPYQPAAVQPPVQQQDASYMMGYRMGTSSPAPMKHEGPGAPPLYVEPNAAAYGYPAGPSATSTVASMIHRPAASTDANSGYAYQSVASGIPSHMGTSERLLPAPSTRSLTSAPQQHPYRAESISSAYSKTSQSSTGSSSPAALSEAATTYNSFESSPLASYPTSAPASHHGRSGEGYTTTAASSLEAIIEPVIEPLRMTAPEFTYKYADTTRRYNSQYNAAIGSYLSSSPGLSNYTLSSDEHERKPRMRT
ncbi:hypothetical protein TRIATDRAFT_91938 [Trichoderma atroviride IMI 206040]|uniref:Zn(2)-C6 fungal-type domain-containing protein n=1 Tax=Hypocrea atroviridis (strain ATCC 20476 / IMI 206040) TaxID=452589 RepID=G9PC39_HYPAI|nr:uncharacterized protein TRIATDRAFT_91938 [Trichoderma atroviride IMI 206040]EHK39421.1 hypothetical protein TRIATDRAFT_91938 [Trichoderma atroviride IMI 206040]